MREIILDTETTGLSPHEGHRLVEIGAVELIDFIPTDRSFQSYINPEREVPASAVNIHGLTTEFLAEKPVFSDVVSDFLDFLGDSPLVIHNAEFDLLFLNFELKQLAQAPLSNKIIDTLSLARTLFPGERASLNALCQRFKIDISQREKQGHGALLDSMLLADVYLEMVGKKQRKLNLSPTEKAAVAKTETVKSIPRRPALSPTAEEEKAHENILAQISKPVWFR